VTKAIQRRLKLINHVIQVVEDFAGEEVTREWQPSAALLSQSEAS
jgi:hypothetical protein